MTQFSKRLVDCRVKTKNWGGEATSVVSEAVVARVRAGTMELEGRLTCFRCQWPAWGRF